MVHILFSHVHDEYDEPVLVKVNILPCLFKKNLPAIECLSFIMMVFLTMLLVCAHYLPVDRYEGNGETLHFGHAECISLHIILGGLVERYKRIL